MVLFYYETTGPVWEIMHIFSVPDSVKALLHWAQGNGFLPVWERMCLFSVSDREKALLR